MKEKMKKLTWKEIDLIHEKHLHYLLQDEAGWEGMRACFDSVIIRDKNLTEYDFRHAEFSNSFIKNCNFKDVRFGRCYFESTTIEHTNFDYCDMHSCKFVETEIIEDIFISTNLYDVQFIGSDMRKTNFYNSFLNGVSFDKVKNIPYIPMVCPSEGSFIGWKKCITKWQEEVIVKLFIPGCAKRVSGTSRQCRCDRAYVLDIQDLDGNVVQEETYSYHHKDFEYKIGELVKPSNGFDGNRWNICSRGIHFFLDRDEAVKYMDALI